VIGPLARGFPEPGAAPPMYTVSFTVVSAGAWAPSSVTSDE
jgi:hypothetical protein